MRWRSGGLFNVLLSCNCIDTYGCVNAGDVDVLDRRMKWTIVLFHSVENHELG
jgi:hypothetical protein